MRSLSVASLFLIGAGWSGLCWAGANPNPLVWQFDGSTLSNRTYFSDLDFIKANTSVDLVSIAPIAGVLQEDPPFVAALEELVPYAHQLGIRVVLRASHVKGFFNAVPEKLDHPEDAQGLVYDAEAILDAQGRASFTETARWARPKILPLSNTVLRAYAFTKTADGFYDPASLEDVTDRLTVTSRTERRQTVTAELGAAFAGKTLFLMTVQYFHWYELFGGGLWRQHKAMMDSIAHIPMDGFCMDEQGYMLLDFLSVSNPWRARYYSPGQEAYFRDELNLDLARLLFDMRYAPADKVSVRVQAINRYFEEMSKQPLKVERQVAEYQKKLWGDDVFLSCHNTFHNNLQEDDIWHTGCKWWSIPRDYGFTDEDMILALRMGVLALAKKPLLYDMYYSKSADAHYRHIVNGAPFCSREWHHAYNDEYWGSNFKDLGMLGEIRKLDEAVAALESKRTSIPKLDLVVVFGTSAQWNWYPNAAARNAWDIDGTLNVQDKAAALWNAGYRCALVPDTVIDEGLLTREGTGYRLGGHPVPQMLFLYPKYAKKSVYAFLNDAVSAGAPLTVVGSAETDFDGEPASFAGTTHDTLTTGLLEDKGCPKSAIPGGCVYEDGSVGCFGANVRSGELTDFDFTAGGVRYTGSHSGVLFYKPGEAVAYGSSGSSLLADGKAVPVRRFGEQGPSELEVGSPHVDVQAKTVTVPYVLKGAGGIVTAQFLTNGVRVAESAATSLTGDVNRKVAGGPLGSREASLVWHAGHDIPDFPHCDVTVLLSFWSEANPPDYMAVNLQAPNSVAYYTSTNALPGGIGSDRWRTGEILLRKIRAKGMTFPMGKNSSDASRITEHLVTLTNDYYIGVFELTQSQLYNIEGKDTYYPAYGWTQSNKFANPSCNATRPADNLLWRTLKGTTIGTDTANWSVIGKLNAKSGLVFDLPTEAQWEFACRAGTEANRYCTDILTTARTRYNGGMDGLDYWPYTVSTDKATARVGSYAPNAYGLYDMYGNVNELCLDHYKALTDGQTVTEPLVTTGDGCVARGGNCTSEGGWLNSSMRMGPNIETMTNSSAMDLYGARFALRIAE